jgi:hypothetical protein
MGVVIASDIPAQINEVFVVKPYRYRVVRQLTREEFLRQMAENRRHEDHESRTFSFEGSRMVTSEDATRPTPEQKYYYAVEVV